MQNSESKENETLKELTIAGKSVPIWKFSTGILEEYFKKNLSQVSHIFWLSVVVMFIGFLIIAWGTIRAINTPNGELASIIATVSGVITELIGASFLLIFKSTMKQADTYTKTLDRMNSVGIATQILDTMKEQDNLKEQTKAEVVKLLLSKAYESDDSEETEETDAE
jgi:nitrate reductase gamma subunit